MSQDAEDAESDLHMDDEHEAELQPLGDRPSDPYRMLSHGAPGGDLDVERHSKSVFMLVFTLCLVLILVLGKIIPSWNVYDLLGICLSFTIASFVVATLWAIFSFDELHFIRVRRRRYPKAKYLFLPYGYEEDESSIIYAISWLAALRGSNIQGIVSTFLYLTFALMFAVACNKWMEHEDFVFARDIHVILFVTGAYGLFSTSTWNLERHDVKYSGLLHNLSALMSVICGPLAFMVQQHWGTFSVVLGTLAVIVFVCWFVYVEYVDRMGIKFDRKDVHKVSLRLLLLELSGMVLVFTTAILYAFELGSVNASLQVSHYKDILHT